MGDKNFSGGVCNSDLWPMGFDIDLNLESRKQPLNNAGSMTNDSTNYEGMIFHKCDVLNDGDITDLTNSLPKGNTDTTAQSLIAKLACHELTPELGSQTASIKSTDDNDDNFLLPQTSSLLIPDKPPLQPVDVYGRVTLVEGKLILQLRHFNSNTNYPVNVEECWLCREKLCTGSSIHCHKHILQGLFQINDEFIQMDIDHYLMPEQVLESGPPVINNKERKTSANRMSENSVNNMKLSKTGSMKGNECNNIFSYSEAPAEACSSSTATHKTTNARPSSNSVMYNHQQQSENFYRHTTYEPNISQKENFFTDHYYNPSYPSYDQSFNSQSHIDLEKSHLPVMESEPVYQTLNSIRQTTTTSTSTTNSCSSRTTEIGAKKRKSRTQKKSSMIKMKDELAQMSCTGYSNDSQYLSSQWQKQPETASIPLATNNSSVPPSDTSSTMGISPTSSNTLTSAIVNTKETTALVTTGAVSSQAKNLVKNSNSSNKKELKKKTKSKSSVSIANKKNKKVVVKKSAYRIKARIEKLRRISSRDLIVSCQICRMEFKNNLLIFKDHLLEHKLSPSFVFLCSCCSKSVSNIDKFIQHLKTHCSNRLSCKLCQKSFGETNKLERHFDSVHSKYRAFKCDICPLAFSRSDHLKDHRKVHFAKTNRFQCNVCHKFYSTKYNLNIHRKHHFNDLSFVCNICDKAFPRASNLEMHKFAVHGPNKFYCDICDKNFSRADVLIRHVNTIHKEPTNVFNCETCHKKFSRKDQLQRHIREHNEAKQFKCNLCPTVFQRKTCLQRHLKIHNEKEQCNICLKFVPSPSQLKKHLRWHETQLKVRFEREYLSSHTCELLLLL